jgi:hypothetical protein
MKKTLLPLTLIVVLSTASGARADGLPLPVDETNSGVVTDAGDVRFLTASARGRTAFFAQDTHSGAVITADLLKGRFTVPLVSYDGTAGGLSGDERTVALIRPRRAFPRKDTTFAVFDADPWRSGLRLRRMVRLRGDFSFDALSRNGRQLFLINYISPRNPRRYRVRVYDLKRGRLAPEPIVDPREDPDEMNGFPVSRATSSDHRWAYTLYEGKHHPFIHALDMDRRKAVCIDLDDVKGDPYALRLEADPGGPLALKRGESTIRVVDTSSFEVSTPQEAAPEKTGGIAWPMPWAVIALLVAALAGLGARARAR